MEYRSKQEWHGIPIVAVPLRGPARVMGVVAVGRVAIGVVSVGLVSSQAE